MKFLYYNTYCSGRTGLSNNMMSLEVGVVLAFLTERVLVLEGNVSPSSNMVDYAGRVSNRHPSRLCDLVEMPVPWMDATQVDLRALDSKELTESSLMDSVFYYPPTLDTTSADFHSFARGRTNLLTCGDELGATTVLRLSGGPPVGEMGLKLHNFSFYSYFFYLGEAHRGAVHQLLRRMAPRAPFAELARSIVSSLGDFNAVHVRRGDFRQVIGVTTRDRTADHALEVMDRSFRREDRLVILTDESSDPFFDGIVECYPDCVFLDQYILDHHGEEFHDLPFHDSIALAFLSQLVASDAQDFIGSMTSTFTSIIQRWRGTKGLHEPFKFLWNEIPDEGDELEPGRHRFSECVPMQDGVMIEEFEGPYSWNRYNQRFNPAWMREWPESFLIPATTAKSELE